MFKRLRTLPPGYVFWVKELPNHSGNDLWFGFPPVQLEVYAPDHKVAAEIMPIGTGRAVRRRLRRAAWLDYRGRE